MIVFLLYKEEFLKKKQFYTYSKLIINHKLLTYSLQHDSKNTDVFSLQFTQKEVNKIKQNR